jgi:stage II sporulation protein M
MMDVMIKIMMSAEERSIYLGRLKPYLAASLILFGVGIVVGLIIMRQHPSLAGYLENTLAAFVKNFAGMPRIQLAGAIFLNNALKTLIAILLGSLLGIIPAIFLLANGVVLGVAWTLSSNVRGPWLSLVSLFPHGVLELPAVFLGTSIGLMIGLAAFKRMTGSGKATVASELALALRYFCSVIVPLLFAAALVEAFITAALVTPR